jgi:hypothetical protein
LHSFLQTASPLRLGGFFPFRPLHGQTTTAKPRSREASKGERPQRSKEGAKGRAIVGLPGRSRPQRTKTDFAAKNSRKRKKAEPHPRGIPTSVSPDALLSADRFPFAALRLGGFSPSFLHRRTTKAKPRSREASKVELPQRTQGNAKRQGHTGLAGLTSVSLFAAILPCASGPLREISFPSWRRRGRGSVRDL